ncbi:hypothetical protein GCM10009092_20060 [Bowmanella denitrificans]|uniref:DUF805 domain-containing protein n=1 Tax=Bowmanella denitrificans TaxID=366582 RepID=A0ABN0X5M5_9ALTE
MQWYKKFFSDYFTFSTRSRREEYWMVFLINFVVSLVLSLLGGIPGLIYSLVIMIPSLAIMVRRLHDTGKSGWWALLMLIPLLGFLVLLLFLIQDSQPEENQWGPNPKAGLAD